MRLYWRLFYVTIITMTFTNTQNKFILAVFLALGAVTAFAQGNKPVALLKGQITSTKGGNVSDVNVSAYEGGKLINSGKTNTDGKFQIILKSGITYKLTYSNSDYYYQEEQLVIAPAEKYQEIQKTIQLKPLELNSAFPFATLVFEPKSSKIEAAVMTDLENIANAAKRNKLSLRCTVYPDATPSGKNAATQNDLASARKTALTSYFMSKNLSASNFSIDINNSLPAGKFERTITETPEETTTKGKKKKSKTAAKPVTKKVMVPQYAEIMMVKG
jgi:hypothetical protein